jgi:hypothetical protein
MHSSLGQETDANGHYLVHSKYKYFLHWCQHPESEEELDQEEDDCECNIFHMMQEYKNYINHYHHEFILPAPRFYPHPLIRNYEAILERDDYIRPELAECVVLETGECIAILKTFWIRIIQRAWKRVFQERQRIIRLRCRPMAIHFRTIHRDWPQDCFALPTIKGCLLF